MANNSLRPPWIKNKTTRNIAKRARFAAILKKKQIAEAAAVNARPPVAR